MGLVCLSKVHSSQCLNHMTCFLLFFVDSCVLLRKKSCEYFHSGIVRDGIPLWKWGGWSNIIPAARVMPTFWILRDYETWKIRSWSQIFGWEDSTDFRASQQRKSFQTATVVDFSRGMFKGHVGMILYRWNRFFRDPVAQGFRLRGCLPAWVVLLWSPWSLWKRHESFRGREFLMGVK